MSVECQFQLGSAGRQRLGEVLYSGKGESQLQLERQKKHSKEALKAMTAAE